MISYKEPKKGFREKLSPVLQAILGIGTISLLVAVVFVPFFIYSSHSGFGAVESREVKNNIQQGIDVLQNEIEQIGRKVKDYSPWDETYAFAENRNPSYTEEYFGDITLENLDVNLVIITDIQGEILFSKTIKFENDQINKVDFDHRQLLIEYPDLVIKSNSDTGIKGFIQFQDRILMIASYPILTNQFEGPSRGTLMFGRFLDEQELQKISLLTHLETKSHQYDSEVLPDDFRLAKFVLTGEGNRPSVNLRSGWCETCHPIKPGNPPQSGNLSYYINPIDDEYIGGYTILKDLREKPISILAFFSHREINKLEKKNQIEFVFLLFGTLAVLASINIFLIRRNIKIQMTNQQYLSRYKTIIMQNPEAIFIIDNILKILDANPASEKLFNFSFSKDQIIGLEELILEDKDELIKEYGAESLLDENGETIFRHYRCKGRKELDIEANLSLIPDDKMKLHCLMLHDVTTHKQLEAALDSGYHLLRTVIDMIPDQIYARDTDCRFTLNNLADARVMGVDDPESLLRKGDEHYYPPDLAARYQADDHLVMDSGQALIDREEPSIGPGGRQRWTLTTKIPLKSIHDQVIGLVGITRDITERKRSEEEIQQLNKELESFSYSVSHDLRAPLRIINSFSQILLDDFLDQLDPKAQEYLHRIMNATLQMSHLIEDLLKLAQINKCALKVDSVDLGLLSNEILADLRTIQPDRRVDVLLPSNWIVQADPHLMRIAMDNLVRNAWKFTSKLPEAHIELGCFNQNGQQVHFIRDNGAGFDMKYADKLFGAFQRLHSAVEYEGTGIGLAIVQRIIARHGGQIWAEGDVNQGATFYFSLG